MNNKNLLTNLRKNWYKLYFLVSIILAIWTYGLIVGTYQIYPFKIIQNAKMAAEDWIKDDNYKHYAKIRPEKLIYPAKHLGSNVTINVTGKTFDGYTLIASMWNHTNGFKLIDMDGTEIHNWSVSYNNIFPLSTTNSVTDWDVLIHGFVIYPNGDIVFTFNGHGLVKIDKNSNILWKLKENYHHSAVKDENGNLWVPSQTYIQDNTKYPLLVPPYFEDFICKLSPAGELLKRISLLEIIYKSDLEALLVANGWSGTIKNTSSEITHLNDIDILGSELANQYPQFNSGDIMVSLRQPNLILVIDSETYQIKWHMTGPYIRQHDPDFTPNGDIIVFDNRTDNSNGELLGGSRILKFDPLSRIVDIAYQGDFENKFYTEIVGKQQLLPNDNILIVEFETGRIFEVTDTGEIIWNYINRYDEDEVYVLPDAMRISKSYLTFLR